jgi:spore germination protein YaaH
MRKQIIVWYGLSLLLFSPHATLAVENNLYYAGWLPFWKQESGVLDVLRNFQKIDELNPFSYEVNSKGVLIDKLGLDAGFWPATRAVMRRANVKVIPTIAWFDGPGIHKLLSNKKTRIAHENAITKLVTDNKFDGIDIDYEAKLEETNPYFSLFIEGLAIRLHPKRKLLVCTVESRTPLASLREIFPDDVPRANNYAVLNRYCDQVRIMAYDQGLVDFKLDTTKGNGNVYAPIADPEWVEKVIRETTKEISPKKIVLGIPTYGYMYAVNWDNGALTYRRLRAINYLPAMDLARELGSTPLRTSAGELGFTYTTSTFVEVSPALRRQVSSTLPQNVLSSIINSSGSIMRYVTFTDAEAVRQKIQLAKKYKLKGVALFKFDGEADPAIWGEMK